MESRLGRKCVGTRHILAGKDTAIQCTSSEYSNHMRMPTGRSTWAERLALLMTRRMALPVDCHVPRSIEDHAARSIQHGAGTPQSRRDSGSTKLRSSSVTDGRWIDRIHQACLHARGRRMHTSVNWRRPHRGWNGFDPQRLLTVAEATAPRLHGHHATRTA